MSQAVDKYFQLEFRGVSPGRSFTRRNDRWLPTRTTIHEPASNSASFAPMSPADLRFLMEIFRQAQLSLADYRPTTLRRRIPACLRALQVSHSAQALRRLENDPASLQLALNALLIGVTKFFRDLSAFEFLQSVALRWILQDSPQPTLMSVGCANGEELYSLAICLHEAGVTEYHLHGLDCRNRAIGVARTASYSPPALENLSDHLRAKYLDPLPRAYRVKPMLRANLHWHVSDALTNDPLPLPRHGGLFDFIACRNLAIYLQRSAAARLWQRLHTALRTGGLLFTGRSERPLPGFECVGPCLYRKGNVR